MHLSPRASLLPPHLRPRTFAPLLLLAALLLAPPCGPGQSPGHVPRRAEPGDGRGQAVPRRAPDRRASAGPAPRRGGPTPPWELDLSVTRGLPGAFDPPTTFTPRAGVSTLARLADGTLVAGFQWFPADDAAAFDRIALRTSADEGATWSAPRRVDFVGLPEAMTRQFDPTLVPLPDGRLRLYFTGNQGAPTLDATIGIYSAVSSDLATFTFEPGERFGLDDDPVIDCAVARLGDTYHLLAPRPGPPGAALHATSADGLAFARQPDIVGANWQNWTGNLMATSTGLHFFGTPAAGAPPGGVWTSSTTDGVVWSAPTSLGVAGGDPAALLLGDGRLLVTTTLPPTPAPVVSSTGIMLYGR